MNLQQLLYTTFLNYLNENYAIKSLDHLKEVFALESEKIYNFISSKLKSEIILKNANNNAQEIPENNTNFIINEETILNSSLDNNFTEKPGEVFVCEEKECTQAFISKEEFKGHLDSHQQEEVKENPKSRINCKMDGCLTTFASRNALLNHLRKIHKDIKTQCGYCQKSYKYSSSLKYHVNKFHLKINPFRCIYLNCEKMFPSRNNWVNHVKKCRNSKVTDNNPKKYDN